MLRNQGLYRRVTCQRLSNCFCVSYMLARLVVFVGGLVLRLASRSFGSRAAA
jgi:hypothetical protein